MPICYDIDIDIIRDDAEEGALDRVLPRTIEADETLTNEQIETEVVKFWNEFIGLLTKYGPERVQSYRRGQGYQIKSVYRC